MLPILLTALMAGVAPGEIQSTTDLDQLVAQFTGKPVGAEGGARAPVDARLRLAACAAPQLDWRTPAKDAVVIRCMAPMWRIFVPAVATTPPPAAAPAPGTVTAAAAPPAPPPAPVVKRNDPVTVEARSAGFSITRDGIALGDAAPGERLMVRVDPQKPPIQAIAVAPGRVTLPAFAQ